MQMVRLFLFLGKLYPSGRFGICDLRTIEVSEKSLFLAKSKAIPFDFGQIKRFSKIPIFGQKQDYTLDFRQIKRSSKISIIGPLLAKK